MDNRVETLISNIAKLRDFVHSQEDLKNVRLALNSIFMPDAECVNFVYTLNTDKLPFGCITMPVLSGQDVENFFIVGSDTYIKKYEIEIDSKMFDYGLTDQQIAEIMLFNIYHLVKNSKPTERVREFVDDYLTERAVSLVIRSSVQYQALLRLGLCDALNLITSCLYLPNDVQNDAFLESLELDDFKNALDKLYHQIPGCENEASRLPQLSILKWCLRVYDNIEKERIPAIHILNRSKVITASLLYTNLINSAINALNRIDTDMFINEAVEQVFLEAKRKGGLLASLKYNGLRDIEADLYEFQLRARNAETEQEVIYALKQVNARLAILDDYIRENQDDPELDRWVGVKMEYLEIRDVLAKKKLHKRSYGIFVDYDKLDQLDDEEE